MVEEGEEEKRKIFHLPFFEMRGKYKIFMSGTTFEGIFAVSVLRVAWSQSYSVYAVKGRCRNVIQNHHNGNVEANVCFSQHLVQFVSLLLKTLVQCTRL